MLWNNACIKCILKHVMETVLTNLIPRYTVAGLSLSTPDTAESRYSSSPPGTARLVEGPASGNIQQTLILSSRV